RGYGTLEGRVTQVASKKLTDTRSRIEDRMGDAIFDLPFSILDPRSSTLTQWLSSRRRLPPRRGLRRWRPPPRCGFGSSVRRTGLGSPSPSPMQRYLEWRLLAPEIPWSPKRRPRYSPGRSRLS